MRSVKEVPDNSIVFLRTGMDVPLENGKITDPSRIEETRPTIDLLRSKNCTIIVSTHIGRPKGEDKALSAKPVADYLSQFYPVKFHPYPLISQLEKSPGTLIVTENLRYDTREEKNDKEFAKALVSAADVVVQDAYANCHRDHASMTGVLNHTPGYAGLLLEKELVMMQKLEHPEHPYVAIIGGAKADKLTTIRGLLQKVDVILVGGVLANTFLKAVGMPTGDSRVDETGLAEAAELYKSGKILIPVDAVVADRFDKDSPARTLPVGAITHGMILDIGPETTKRYTLHLDKAKTIVWGGPIGVFEWPAFAEGTKQIAVAVALNQGYTLAAGGDSGAALVALGYKDNISHVSTGGGVTLQLLEGKPLVAVQALEENAKKFKQWSGTGADFTC
jgi:3-phosphoglycerate kinase